MKQVNIAKFVSDDGKIEVFCESSTALGELHDFLVSVRREIVERMNKDQKEDISKFFSEDGKIKMFSESSIELGKLHDFLVSLRGEIVERMIKAQNEDEEQAKEQERQKEEIKD